MARPSTWTRHLAAEEGPCGGLSAAHSELRDFRRSPDHLEMGRAHFPGQREAGHELGAHRVFTADGRAQGRGRPSAEPLLHPLHKLLGQLGVPLGLLGVPRLKHSPVGLLDELKAQGGLHTGSPHSKPGPVSEEVAADGSGLGRQGSWGLGSACAHSSPRGQVGRRTSPASAL